MEDKLWKCQSFMFLLSEWMEFAMSILIVVGIIVRMVSLPGFLQVIPEGGLDSYLQYLFDFLIGIELIKLLCGNHMSTLLEVLLYAITRHIVIERPDMLESLLGAIAIVLLFVMRGYLHALEKNPKKATRFTPLQRIFTPEPKDPPQEATATSSEKSDAAAPRHS